MPRRVLINRMVWQVNHLLNGDQLLSSPCAPLEQVEGLPLNTHGSLDYLYKLITSVAL